VYLFTRQIKQVVTVKEMESAEEIDQFEECFSDLRNRVGGVFYPVKRRKSKKGSFDVSSYRYSPILCLEAEA
jgi:hypothetical protein